MPAKDLGAKYACFKCGTKFYDLKKPEPLCPKCGADQRGGPTLKAPGPAEKRSRPPARPAVEPADDLEPGPEAELEEELDEGADEDPAAVEDDE
jgi:hypothetical protein